MRDDNFIYLRLSSRSGASRTICLAYFIPDYAFLPTSTTISVRKLNAIEKEIGEVISAEVSRGYSWMTCKLVATHGQAYYDIC